MADTSKFGSGRAAQFGDQISPRAGEGGHCAQCEAMLADALDGTLTPADQALFDTHVALCGPCSEMLADAKRGAAWLEMLRDPRPEPPAALLERILAQTSHLQTGEVLGQTAMGIPAGNADFIAAAPAVRGMVVPFRQRFGHGMRNAFLFSGLLQPRLAMTAAMAFFSIALTMNLTGVHLSGLRPADLKPSSIKQTFYSAKARSVRYYEGLRVVYELESRVHDLQSDSDTGSGSSSTPGQQSSPANASPSNPSLNQDNQQPSGSPDQTAPQPSPKPAAKAPGPGSSRRESLLPRARFVAVSATPFSQQQMVPEFPSSTGTRITRNDEWIDERKARARA